MSEKTKDQINKGVLNELDYGSPDIGDISGAILKIFIGNTVGNILPTRLIFWEKYDDPLIVLRDLFASEEERDSVFKGFEEKENPNRFTADIKVSGGGKKEKTIYGKLYNEIKDNIKKLTEEQEDLEFIIENYEELKKTVEKAVEKTKNKKEKNIEQIKKNIKENYEILQKLNIVKLDFVTFLLKKKKKKKKYL